MVIGTAVTAVGASLFNRLVASGMQRVGNLALQKFLRISRIEATLKSNSQRNPNVRAAIGDFETLIGNRYGKYTEDLAKFFEELERSGVINAMVENALLDRPSEQIKASFLSMHSKSISPAKENGEALYEQMTKSFSISLRELTKDKILLDTFRISHTRIMRRLEQLDEALITHPLHRKDTSKLSLEQLHPILLKFAKAMHSQVKTVRIETTKGARDVEIAKIYIPPKLRYRDPKKSNEIVARAAHVASGNRLSRAVSGWDNTADKLGSITYNELRSSFSKIVILGDPGGGKSTICQNICYDLARQAISALSTSGRPAAQLQKFPLRVILRHFEKARTIEPQLSIFDYLFRELHNHVSIEVKDLRSSLLYLLESGSAILAFDGLDEILNTAQRREFVDLVGSFCDQYPLCPVLVTSRLVGYDDARLSNDFEELILERFEVAEIVSYLTKFFKVVGGRTDADASKLAADFLTQTTANAADLRNNPLMLGLMGWLFLARGDVPSNRPEIYKECAVLMFERWDPDRAIIPDIPRDFDKLQLFSGLAAKIFGDPELSGGVDRDWLESAIREQLESLYESRSRAIAGAKSLVKFITGRAWVMTDVGDRIYNFTHQTFLEYFFARHVDEMTDTVKQVIDEILPHVLRREWDVVSHLSLQIKTYRNQRRENEALTQISEALSVASSKEDALALNIFAAKSLEYLVGSEIEMKQIIGTIVTNGLRFSADESVLQPIFQAASCCRGRRNFVEEYIIELFKIGIKAGIDEQMSLLANSIDVKQGLDREHIHKLGVLIKSGVQSFITERIARSQTFAEIGWSWYGLVNRALINKFGLEVYYNRTVDQGIIVDGLTGVVLIAAEFSNEPHSLFSPKVAQEALSLIGQVGFSKRLILSKLSSAFVSTGPPLPLWKEFMDGFKSPNVLAGAFYAFLASRELERKVVKPEEIATDEELTDEAVIDHVLNNQALKALSIYPNIVAVAKGSVFEEA